MSWRDVARAAVQREAGEEPGALAHSGNNDNNADPADLADTLAEREAIAIIDGGLPPTWAAALSMLERGPKPADMTADNWRAALDRVWSRADQHGAAFAACGWTFEEVFDVGESWLRLDRRGAAWFAQDARIVSIDPQRIIFERRSGERTTAHRKGLH